MSIGARISGAQSRMNESLGTESRTTTGDDE